MACYQSHVHACNVLNSFDLSEKTIIAGTHRTCRMSGHSEQFDMKKFRVSKEVDGPVFLLLTPLRLRS